MRALSDGTLRAALDRLGLGLTAGCLGASIALSGCAQPNATTGVLVVLSADDPEVERRLTTVEAHVFAAVASNSDAPHQSEVFTLGGGPTAGKRVAFPFSFAVTKVNADRFLLVIRGYDERDAEPVIERKVIARFQAHRTLLLEVALSAACLDRAGECSSFGETCAAPAEPSAAASCVPIVESPVRHFSPGDELRDAGSRDATDATVQEGIDSGAEGPARDAESGSSDGAVPTSQRDGALDATRGDDTSIGADARASDPSAMATPNAPCDTAGARACDGHNGKQRLICFNGLWSLNGSCDGESRCQTKPTSAEVGSCLPIAPGCTGKSPGDDVCEGTVRRRCGVDLLDYETNACPAHASCNDQGGNVRCRCDSPYVDDGTGGCTAAICLQMPCMNNGVCSASGAGRSCDCSAIDYSGPNCETKIDDCAVTPCQRGTCTDGTRSRSCDCSGTGFTGPECGTNVNECAGPNLCSGTVVGVAFSYPCVDATGNVAGYHCLGQYPDWPVPTASSNRFSASGGVVTDSQTGLRWQQAASPSTHTWASAGPYCRSLPLAGGGWRLPSRLELLSIVDYTRLDPAIDPVPFPNTPNEAFWTSSIFVGLPAQAWSIYFPAGSSSQFGTASPLRVRCVR